LPKEG